MQILYHHVPIQASTLYITYLINETKPILNLISLLYIQHFCEELENPIYFSSYFYKTTKRYPIFGFKLKFIQNL